MPAIVTDDGVTLHVEEGRRGRAAPVRPRVRRRPPQLGAAAAVLLRDLPLRHLRGPRLPAVGRARRPRGVLARARGRGRDRRARRPRDRPRARGRPVDGRLHRPVPGAQAPGADRIGGGGRAPATAPSRSIAGAFRAESMLTAAAFVAEGAAKVAERYAVRQARVQFQNKNPRGWAELAAALAGHSSLGSALTMRGVQVARPSLYALTDELAKVSVPVLVLVGDEDEGCLEPALMLKRTIPTAAWPSCRAPATPPTWKNPTSSTAPWTASCPASPAARGTPGTQVPLGLHHRHELTSAPFLTERAGSPPRWLMNRDAAQRHPGIRGFLVTKTSGGCPGLQAGEESGPPRSGAR